MATDTQNGNVVHAYRVATIPDNASPLAWAPPTLTSVEPSHRLSMTITPKQDTTGQQQQESEAKHYVSEQGMVLIP